MSNALLGQTPNCTTLFIILVASLKSGVSSVACGDQEYPDCLQNKLSSLSLSDLYASIIDIESLQVEESDATAPLPIVMT